MKQEPNTVTSKQNEKNTRHHLFNIVFLSSAFSKYKIKTTAQQQKKWKKKLVCVPQEIDAAVLWTWTMNFVQNFAFNKVFFSFRAKNWNSWLRNPERISNILHILHFSFHFFLWKHKNFCFVFLSFRLDFVTAPKNILADCETSSRNPVHQSNRRYKTTTKKAKDCVSKRK